MWKAAVYRFFFAEFDRVFPPGPKGVRRRWALLWTACGIFSVGAGTLLGVVVAFLGELPPTSELRAYKPSLTTKIFDRNAELVSQLFEQHRELVPLSKIPPALPQAFIALEDQHFYRHGGIDFLGIVRAVAVAAVRFRHISATSTITQQLARNLFLTQERSVARKIKEALLALQIESRFRKDEILELYLNQIYFGYSAYGVEAAARTYFGKKVEELSLSECAVLAGIPKSPNAFNPLAQPDKALQRRATVLDRMVRMKFLTAEQAAATKEEPLRLEHGTVSAAPYFVEQVRQDLDDRYGSNLVNRGGLQVTTTLDARLQEIAEKAMHDGLADAESRIRDAGLAAVKGAALPPLQGAFVCLDPKTGSVLAMIGGRDFKQSPYNRAVQARRQPGSSFKPFVYGAALENGFTPADVLLDAAMVFTDASGKEWKPENFEGKFFGPTLVRDALTHSRNVCTVKLLQKVGPAAVVDLARRMGVESPLRTDLTLALGTSELTLLEMVSAFGALAHAGTRVPPYLVSEVKDSDGNVREQSASTGREAIAPATAYVLVEMMKNVINQGTATTVRAAGFGRPCAGKTGTTTNFTDAWFIGFTPDLVAGIWLGFDNRKSLGKLITGGTTCAPIWAAFMKEANKVLELPSSDFPMPDKGVDVVEIDARTGLRATAECPNRVRVAFVKGTAPTRLWTDPENRPELWNEENAIEPIVLETPTMPDGSTTSAPFGVSGTAQPAPSPTPEFRF